MGRTLKLADNVDEIRLAAAKARGGVLSRLGRRDSSSSGALRVTDEALTLRAPGEFEEEIEFPWNGVRKLVVDDGDRWGYVSGVCRFPVYDLRPDGSGSGVLIGPLWSTAAALLPDGCPNAAVEPVPGEAPNVAILLDPPIAVGPRNGSAEAEWIAILLLRAEDPGAAREALAAHGSLGDLAHDDLEYLTAAARRPGHPVSGQQPFAESA